MSSKKIFDTHGLPDEFILALEELFIDCKKKDVNDLTKSMENLKLGTSEEADENRPPASNDKVIEPPPTTNEIIKLAKSLGYYRHPRKPSTPKGRLFFTLNKGVQGKRGDEINIHVYFNTKTVLTIFNHPVEGLTKVWRKDAYTNLKSLSIYFINPSVQTDFDYSKKEHAKALCKGCYKKLTRCHFEAADWRRVGREGEIIVCKVCKEKKDIPDIFVPSHKQEPSSLLIQQWVNEGRMAMVPIPPDLDVGTNLRASIDQPRNNQERTKPSPYQKNGQDSFQSLKYHHCSSQPKIEDCLKKSTERGGMSPLRRTSRYTLNENVIQSKCYVSSKPTQRELVSGWQSSCRYSLNNENNKAQTKDKESPKQLQRKLVPLMPPTSSRYTLRENSRWRTN